MAMHSIRNRLYSAHRGAKRVRFFRSSLEQDVFDSIVYTSQFINKDFLQRQGQHIEVGGLHCLGLGADLPGLAPDDEGA